MRLHKRIEAIGTRGADALATDKYLGLMFALGILEIENPP
jgi:hypothetical protein